MDLTVPKLEIEPIRGKEYRGIRSILNLRLRDRDVRDDDASHLRLTLDFVYDLCMHSLTARTKGLAKEVV